jgi:hypothetical protein
MWISLVQLWWHIIPPKRWPASGLAVLRTRCFLGGFILLSGCDPMWAKQSLVEVAPRSFPECVEGALTSAGHSSFVQKKR